MEDYKKKYENALEWIKDIYPTLEGAAKEDAEHYFPELRESEDERILKIIKKTLISYNRGIILGSLSARDIVDCLAWLEKQGEPTVVYDRDNYNSAKEKAWDCKRFSNNINNKTVFTEGFQDGYQFGIHEEKPYRWTLHDETVRKEAIACLTDWVNKFPSIYSIDYENIVNWLKDELSVHAEEKQGEQSYCNGEVNDEALQQQLQIWFDKGKYSGRDEVIFHPENFGLQKQGEQKPAWSEEDEKQARQIERIVHDSGCTRMLQKQIADWLKSLKERMKGE